MSGKHTYLGDALRHHLPVSFATMAGRYFSRAIEPSVAAAEQVETAQHYVLSADAVDVPGSGRNGRSAVFADPACEVASLGLGESQVRLDLAELSVLMFRNRGHGRNYARRPAAASYANNAA